MNEILSRTLDAHLPAMIESFFQENILVKAMMNEPYIITYRQMLQIQNALRRKSKQIRAEAIEVLKGLPKQEGVKQLHITGGDKINYGSHAQ